MDNKKLDAALASAVKDAKPFQKFLVLLRTDKGNFAGSFSASAIKELSDQSWCIEIRLWQKVSPKR